MTFIFISSFLLRWAVWNHECVKEREREGERLRERSAAHADIQPCSHQKVTHQHYLHIFHYSDNLHSINLSLRSSLCLPLCCLPYRSVWLQHQAETSSFTLNDSHVMLYSSEGFRCTSLDKIHCPVRRYAPLIGWLRCIVRLFLKFTRAFKFKVLQ